MFSPFLASGRLTGDERFVGSAGSFAQDSGGGTATPLGRDVFDSKNHSVSLLWMRSLPRAPAPVCSLSPPAGESINPRVAGLIGRSGPQNKQPFMVAFFKATEVHLRSIRSASGGGKQRNPNRSKGAKSQEALRVANVAGKPAKPVSFQTPDAGLCCCTQPPPPLSKITREGGDSLVRVHKQTRYQQKHGAGIINPVEKCEIFPGSF